MTDSALQPADAAWMTGLRVPAHWTRSRVKRLVRSMRAGDAITIDAIEEAGDYPVYGANGLRGFTSRRTHRGTHVLIGRQGALCGNVHLVSGEFWASEHAIVATPSADVDERWLAALLQVMNLGQYSTSAAQPGIGVGQIAPLHVYVPPPDEQRVIANYLDHETAQIDALVAKQEEFIGLLRERRSSEITSAVTGRTCLTGSGQSDARHSLVHSGNDYLGAVPPDWEVSRFGRHMVVNGGQVDPREEPWAGMVLVAPNHIESGTGRILGRESARAQGADSGKYLARRGQILYSKIRPALNKVAIAAEDCLCSADMYAMSSLDGSDDSRYLTYFMLSKPFHEFMTQLSMRVKMPKVNREELSSAPWLRPPAVEQDRIATYLDEQTSRIDSLIAKAEEHIALAKERRSALITAAVTGQIDVRTARKAS